MKRTSLIEARLEKGLSQAEAARMLRISRSHYEKLERGVRQPGVHLADAINALFGVQILDASKPHKTCGYEESHDDQHAAVSESA